ncbi:hypothetical protein COO60DRAFT_1525825, partial [Scenedesmus sp. NREL 46B-D3]
MGRQGMKLLLLLGMGRAGQLLSVQVRLTPLAVLQPKALLPVLSPIELTVCLSMVDLELHLLSCILCAQCCCSATARASACYPTA